MAKKKTVWYHVYYIIHDEIGHAIVIGKNRLDAMRRFKNLHGGWKIKSCRKKRTIKNGN